MSSRALSGRLARAAVAVAALIFMLVPAAAYALGHRAHAFENRPLAKAPALSKGWAAFPALTGWASDHLPLRQRAVLIDGWVNGHVFDDPRVPPGQRDSGPVIAGTAAPNTPAGYPTIIEGKGGTWYYGGDFTLACQPSAAADQIMAGLNEVARIIEQSGRKFVAVVPPDKSTEEPQNLPSGFSGTACIDARNALMWPRLDALPYVLDLRPGLAALAPTLAWPLYQPKDTHWDGPAAAYLVSSIVRRLDPAVAARLHPVNAGAIEHVADLATLSGQTDKATFHVVSLAAPGATGPDPVLGFLGPRSAELTSTGPAGTTVAPPTLLLGDSFVEAAFPAMRGVFRSLHYVEVDYSQSEIAAVVRQVVAARNVVLEVLQREFFSGTPILLNPDFLGALATALAANPVH